MSLGASSSGPAVNDLELDGDTDIRELQRNLKEQGVIPIPGPSDAQPLVSLRYLIRCGRSASCPLRRLKSAS